MKNHTSKRRIRPFAAVAAVISAFALMLGVGSSAQALDILDLDTVSLSQAPLTTSPNPHYVEGDATYGITDVDLTGLASSTTYSVSICEWATYSFVPACMVEAEVLATTDGSGNLHIDDFPLLSIGTNAHAALSGQLPTVNCATNLCEVVVTTVHGAGVPGTLLGDSDEFFVL